MKQSTSNSYRQRLINVIDYIYDHLDQDLDINTLADIAMMSPYHFHRIYREMSGETVNATVRRLRLHHAAAELIRSDQPIKRIATSMAYQSVEAFSRAFSKQFGETPSEYRNSKAYRRDQETMPFVAMLPSEKKRYETMYDVEIITMEAIDLVGYHHQGDYMNIGNVFEKLFLYAGSQELLNEQTRSLGLYYDDPKSVDADKLRSMACITMPENAALSGDNPPEKITVPAGRYATVVFKGAYAELEKPYSWLFGEWLPESGYETADFPPVEEYLNDPKETPPGELLTRIHCPLV